MHPHRPTSAHAEEAKATSHPTASCGSQILSWRAYNALCPRQSLCPERLHEPQILRAQNGYRYPSLSGPHLICRGASLPIRTRQARRRRSPCIVRDDPDRFGIRRLACNGHTTALPVFLFRARHVFYSTSCTHRTPALGRAYTPSLTRAAWPTEEELRYFIKTYTL